MRARKKLYKQLSMKFKFHEIKALYGRIKSFWLMCWVRRTTPSALWDILSSQFNELHRRESFVICFDFKESISMLVKSWKLLLCDMSAILLAMSLALLISGEPSWNWWLSKTESSELRRISTLSDVGWLLAAAATLLKTKPQAQPQLARYAYVSWSYMKRCNADKSWLSCCQSLYVILLWKKLPRAGTVYDSVIHWHHVYKALPEKGAYLQVY